MTNINATSSISALDEVVVVQLDIRASDLSGKVERSTDLPTDNMPPANLVTSGVRHFCSPTLKTPFNTFRKAAERACAEVGIPLLKGWAVPKAHAAQLDKDLRKIAIEFNAKADDLVAYLPTAYREWEDANPGWEALLRRDRPEPRDVRAKYRFRHVLYRMRPAHDDVEDPMNEGLGITRGSLLEAILDDVAARSEEILERTFQGKPQVSGRVLTTIGVLAAKLQSFAMVDPLVSPVASTIAEVIQQIGPTGAQLSVTETSALRGLLTLMANPAKLRQHGAAHLSGTTMTVDEVEIDSVVQLMSEAVVMPTPSASVHPTTSAVLM